MGSFRDFGSRLRQIRLRAGLTQEQIAAALGYRGRHRRGIIYRLEQGYFDPGLGLVLGYLRACRATPDDLVALLAPGIEEPLVVPESGRARRRGPRISAREKEELELRREAAPWVLRQLNEYALHQELNRLGVPFFQAQRRILVTFGRRLFRVLLGSRAHSESVRKRRLARTRGWRALAGVPAGLVESVEGAVRSLYEQLEQDGELDRLPDLEQARRMMWRSPGRRITTDLQLCKMEWAQERKRQLDEYQRRAGPVIQGAKAILEQAGVTGPSQGNYLGLINAFINVARFTDPGSAERTEKLEYLFANSVMPWHDVGLLRRLAAFVLEQWDRGT